jgi:hypothetical protein
VSISRNAFEALVAGRPLPRQVPTPRVGDTGTAAVVGVGTVGILLGLAAGGFVVYELVKHGKKYL